MGSGVEPGDTAAELLDLELPAPEIGGVDVGDLESGLDPERTAARDAAEFYIVAALVWRYSEGVGRLEVPTSRIEAAKAACLAFRQFIQDREAYQRRTLGWKTPDPLLGGGHDALWACASARIDELDRILMSPR